MKTYTGKDGTLRISDTTYYLKALFVNSDFTSPVGRNRPEEILVLDRLKFDSNTHFTQGSDSAIAEPLPCSFSFRTFDREAGRELMSWITDHTSIASASATLTTTKGTSVLYDYAGTAHTTNDFTDNSKVCFDVEVKFSGDSGGADLMVRLHEVLFNQGDQTVNESEDQVTINLSGQVYGSIDFGSLDWQTRTDVLT